MSSEQDAISGEAIAVSERIRRLANLKRKLAMIARHEANRLPDGRSAIAVNGGREAWRRRVEAHPGGERGLALELAMRRHYPDLLPRGVIGR
jgi:hypothetical protein